MSGARGGLAESVYEENWFEMCVVPRGAVMPVNRTDGPWAANRPGRKDGAG